MPPPPSSSPASSILTIDLLASVLQQTLFHPFIAWLIPLSLSAVSPSFPSTHQILALFFVPSYSSHAHPPPPLTTQESKILLAIVWALLVSSAWLLPALNEWIASGRRAPRSRSPNARRSASTSAEDDDDDELSDADTDADADEEIVVITGGSSGFGRVLTHMFAMRGASVAVLDVCDPGAGGEEGDALLSANVQWFACDVGDARQVAEAAEKVVRDLGRPSILINNAGIMNGASLWALTPEQVTRNFNTNLLAHFHTIRAFLPGMLAHPSGGTIITVSSVLGKLGAAQLSDYTAAKAGLIAMHTSLRAELQSSNAPAGAEGIRTILVTPGQLATRLFGNVKTPSSFFGPVVEPVELAKEVLKLVDRGVSGEISAPLYARWVQWLGVLPAGLQAVVRWLSGVDRAMEEALGETAGRDQKSRASSDS